ncbi:hypothetical protein A1F99_124670 [Pyrenophora tritici-repentis]|nr:hypothetical protein A1F99_124670 [Pyrenophora tritici-repentis]
MKFLVVCAAFLGLVTAVPVAVPNGNIEERQCEPVKCHGDGTVNVSSLFLCLESKC